MKTLLSLFFISVASAWFLVAQFDLNNLHYSNLEEEVNQHSIQKLEQEMENVHQQRQKLMKSLTQISSQLSFTEAQVALTRSGSSFISHLPTLEMASRQAQQLQNLQTEKLSLQNQLINTENMLTELRLSLLLLQQKHASPLPSLAVVG